MTPLADMIPTMTDAATHDAPAVRLAGVRLDRGGRTILHESFLMPDASGASNLSSGLYVSWATPVLRLVFVPPSPGASRSHAARASTWSSDRAINNAFFTWETDCNGRGGGIDAASSSPVATDRARSSE